MAELHVSKKTIKELFSEMQNKKFVIPDYQRPYQWEIEKCETLWNDIENFAHQTDLENDPDANYFLGTIVSYFNKDKNQEIIDGQQRITSFLLLLRAFYKKLEDMAENKDVIGLKNQLAPCIWDIDRVSQEVSDKTKIHIVSKVATEADNQTFHDILEKGTIKEKAVDNYSKNYKFFKDSCDEYAKDEPIKWNDLCITILNQCIILPIKCNMRDTALTIFSTLNDRGMPLSDSDIFKAQIYRNYSEEKREEFTETWKNLTQICKDGGFPIDDIFRYYSHVLRAIDKDSSKEVGLRKFYAKDEYKRLRDTNIITKILDLAYFWRYVNIQEEPDVEDFGYSISDKARIYLHCLSCYPNEFWKYATSVFFMKNKSSETFITDFENMLRELIAFLFAKFIDRPSVNAIKDDIYNSCISLNEKNKLQYRFILDEKKLSQQIEGYSSSKISRALLLLYAYLHPKQKEFIPEKFHIEHIFPKKWQNTNYNGWTKNDADLYLDRFGNKIVFEKKLNIEAGNGYFGKKKNKYKDSKIATVIELSNYPKDDWIKEDIEEREEKFKETLLNYFREHLITNNQKTA